MIKNVLPLRSKTEALDWNYKGEMTLFLSSVDIDQLQKYGATIISIGDGYYHDDIIWGSELFSCLLDFKNIKE